MREDANQDSWFSTMFDLYALPDDFPGFEESKKKPSPYDRVQVLEDSLGIQVTYRRFVPYIQLHEFEALLFSDPSKFRKEFPNRERAIRQLATVKSQFGNPEMIDDNPSKAPSKRIIQEIPEYEGRKVSAGPEIAGAIGIATLREECPHFGDWLGRLEALTMDEPYR